MQTSLPTPLAQHARRVATDGMLAAALSALVVLWRGHSENRSAASGINAIAHWFWPREAFVSNDVSARFTGTGAVLHLGSSLLWACVYDWLRARRAEPTPVNAVTDAAAVTALAAVVDLRVVPKRLSPGFEERLSRPALALVYVSFGVGLAVGGLLAQRRR